MGQKKKKTKTPKEDIRMDLDESCRTLGKDEMDFYWLHRDDPEKPAEEIVDILEVSRLVVWISHRFGKKN